MLVRNADQRPGAYDAPRRTSTGPSHADYTYDAKYGIRDRRAAGGRQARETVGRVAAGAVARKLLGAARRGDRGARLGSASPRHRRGRRCGRRCQRGRSRPTPTRCPDPDAAARMVDAIEQARRDGDSLGGVVTCVARGSRPGWVSRCSTSSRPTWRQACCRCRRRRASRSAAASPGTQADRPRAQRRLRARPTAVDPATATQPLRRGAGRHQQRRGRSSCGWRSSRRPPSPRPSDGRPATATPTTSRPRAATTPVCCRGPCRMVEAMVLLVLADHWLRAAGRRRAGLTTPCGTTARRPARPAAELAGASERDGSDRGRVALGQSPSCSRRKRWNSAARSSPEGRSSTARRSTSSSSWWT